MAPFREAVREVPDVDVPVDGSGMTMLMAILAYAGGPQWLEIANLLIGAGADVNRRTAAGRPVWDFAPVSGPSAVEIWRALIRAGLDVNARDPDRRTPLLSVSGAYVDPADDRSWQSSRAIVGLLLEAGAQVNVLDQYGVSPLRAAAGVGNVDVVKALLRAGADPDLAGPGARGALFEAAVWGRARAVQVLLRAGARVDAATRDNRVRSVSRSASSWRDLDGLTPLIAAAETGHLAVVRLLVEAGADVQHADSSGLTALLGAARAGHAGLVRFLLERGARADAVDGQGRDAMAHAAECGHGALLAPLLRPAGSGAGPA